MATLTESDLVRISTEAGEHFVESFYTALDGSRNQIASFYVPATGPPGGRRYPHILYNGELIQDGAAFQEHFQKEMPYTHFEVQSLNAHVMNPSVEPIESKAKRDHERNVSLTVQVSGYVRLVERKEGPMRGFSDSFILVPNKEEVGGRGTGKQDHGRRFLIQSQHSRFVV